MEVPSVDRDIPLQLTRALRPRGQAGEKPKFEGENLEMRRLSLTYGAHLRDQDGRELIEGEVTVFATGMEVINQQMFWLQLKELANSLADGGGTTVSKNGLGRRRTGGADG